MDAIWQSYEYLRNQPQIQQSVILLDDRQPESVNTSFTPQAIDQVNRAATLIEGSENREYDLNKGWESDDTREDFIAFSSLLARNFNNFDFAQFANELGFTSLFRAYRDRNDDAELMSFFIRVVNSKDLTPDYWNHKKQDQTVCCQCRSKIRAISAKYV